jgi:phosphatidylglycerol---prolipoprotein diacylglyceryl transferase
MNLFITWDVSPELIEGWSRPNWYAILFVTGLVMGYFVIKKNFKAENIKDEVLDKLVFYVVIATVVGARLGHVLFYGPYFDGVDSFGLKQEGYFSHPYNIIKVWEGGLASHGGALALLIALYIFSRKVTKTSFYWILDRMAAPVAIACCFIRLGNLANSEIVGKATDLPWAFSFPRYFDDVTRQFDATPRHPAQLYEAICYLFIFIILYILFYKKEKWKFEGYIFGLFLMLLFTARFFVEFIKMEQTDRDYSLFLNTGQLLSIPFILVGAFLFIRALKKSRQIN